MRRQRAGKGVAVELVMALDADLERAVGQRPGNAEEHVAVGELPPVQRDACPLIDLTRQQLRGTGDAAAVATAIGQRHALRLQRVEQRPVPIDSERRAAPVGKPDRDLRHSQSQISEVQSPPGYRVSWQRAGPFGSFPKSTKKSGLIDIPPLAVSQSTISMQPPFCRISG